MREYESPSSCYMYDNCPRKYKFRYIEKIREPSNQYADFGIQFENEVYLRWENRTNYFHKGKKIQSMLKVLFDGTREIPQAKYIQPKIDTPCGDSRIIGYADMIHTDDSISDIKTSKSKWDEAKFLSTQQHFFYVYGCKKMGLIKRNFPITFRYLIVTTQQTPQLQIKNILVTERDLFYFEKRFNDRINRISLNYFPTKKSYQCNWCFYKDRCPEWQ